MRVLQVCTALDGGGVDRYLFNYCTRIEEISFDFAIVDTEKKGILESKLEQSSNIFRIPRLKQGVFKNYAVLHSVMTQNRYDAVHVHLGYKGVIALLCAKRCRVGVRIVHSHCADQPQNIFQKISRVILTFATKRLATSLAACGEDAARWMWGAKALNQGKVHLQNNAIDTTCFSFSQAARQQLRDQLGLAEDVLTVGHVGRLCEQKNQLRLLDVFAVLHQQHPRSRLLLVGRGGQDAELRQKIDCLGLQSSVILLGVHEDIPALMSAMDVMIFPSLFEGFPVTLVEAQCNGLPIICSDSVTQSVKLTNAISFLSLRQPDRIWAQAAVKIAGHRLSDGAQLLCRHGYDLNTEADKLRQYYFQQIQ